MDNLISPVEFVSTTLQRCTDLNKVSRILESNPTPRDYLAQINDVEESKTSSSKTSLFPDPFNPLEYWREHSRIKLQELRYKNPATSYREFLRDWIYWKTEAEHWEKKYLSAIKAEPVERKKARYEITDRDYWKCENDHYC